MWPDELFPEDPYPGAVPEQSFVHVAGHSHPLRPGPGGWTVDGVPLDTWLARHGAPPCRERVPLLTYGSNKCPSKITWLRRTHGLGADPVVVLRVRTTGMAAVWASGLRKRDGQRPAVLAAAPGVVESHALWLATPTQIAVLDRCEGRGDRYRLARLSTGTVRTEDGQLIERPWCYLGASPIRRPLAVAGSFVRCASVPQSVAAGLVGEPAASDGLSAATETGAPDPASWPSSLFVYGSLQPGQSAWGLLAPHVLGAPSRAVVQGAVFDTGQGYPAWVPACLGVTPGWVVSVRSVARVLCRLDEYEGPGYARVRVAVSGGRVCWAYAWRGSVNGFRRLDCG